MAFTGPLPQVNQTAAVTAKWPEGKLIIPQNHLLAGWAVKLNNFWFVSIDIVHIYGV